MAGMYRALRRKECPTFDSRGLARVVEALGMGVEREQYGNGALAQPGNALEQAALAVQVVIVVEELADLLDHLLDLGVEPLDVFGDSIAHVAARHLQAIELLRAHSLKAVQAQHQGAQRAFRGRWRLPRLGPALLAEQGDERGIDLVRFSARQPRVGERLDLEGIEHTDPNAWLLGQELGERLPIDAGGFHADMGVGRLVFAQKVHQLGKAGRRVAQRLMAQFAVRKTQGAVQLGLGHIDAQVKRMHANLLGSTL